jgi:alpha-glucosidase
MFLLQKYPHKMKKLIRILLAVLLLSTIYPFSISHSAPLSVDLQSPNGSLRCLIGNNKGQMTLVVTLLDRTIIEESPILMSVDGKIITTGIKAGKARKFKSDESFPLFGLHSVARNIYNGISVPVTHIESGIRYTLEARVFNDAVAFRIIVPGNGNEVRTPDESTVFKLPSNSTTWYHDLYMHYEGVHAKKIIDTGPGGQWAAPPLTFKLPGNGVYASVTEADLLNYAGMALQSDGKNGFVIRLGHSHPASYPYVLRYTKDDVERVSKIASLKGTITTPWRVILVGKDLNILVNSDAIYALCPPPDKKLFPEGSQTEWVKPGRAVWRYLDGGGDQTLKNMKEFSRLAAELGFEYNILEGFWSKWPDDSVRSLVDYSRKLGVGIIVWKHSNTLQYQKARTELFQRCHSLGIAGLKIDFFDHEAKEVIDLYEAILKETAALQLICIFHGANKPTGLWRTWPNAVIYEGVKGMEASKLLDRATHETTIPFTRMLAGPADYSVCHFGARRQNTTWVHQVATAAIYSAPVITYASTPAHILENPCVEMIKSIPSVWDETFVLPPSEIGELAVYAQRKGTTWFLSVINGLNPKTVKIPLSFLGNGSYNTLILNDNPDNPADAIVKNSTAGKNDIIEISLGTGGGYMIRFSR